MRLTEHFRRGIAIVAIKGNLVDENDEALLQDEINSLAADGFRKVVMDLSTLHLINIRGFNALLSAFAKLRQIGGDLKLAHIENDSRDMLALTKIVATFSTYETVGRALASYGR